jgi:hypothetical protein
MAASRLLANIAMPFFQSRRWCARRKGAYKGPLWEGSKRSSSSGSKRSPPKQGRALRLRRGQKRVASSGSTPPFPGLPSLSPVITSDSDITAGVRAPVGKTGGGGVGRRQIGAEGPRPTTSKKPPRGHLLKKTPRVH